MKTIRSVALLMAGLIGGSFFVAAEFGDPRPLAYAQVQRPAGEIGEPPSPAPAPPGVIRGFGSQAASGWESWPECNVTSLASSGPGSLDACIGSTLRQVRITFAVAGTITVPPGGMGDVRTPPPVFAIKRANVVIDGLSAPAPGITIEDPVADCRDSLVIASGLARDVQLRGIRLRGPYRGGRFSGCNDQALPAVDGDAKPAGTVRRVALYRVTIVDTMDAGGDLWGRIADLTYQKVLWLGNRHPITIARPPDNFRSSEPCLNDDGSLCHPDGVTLYQNVFADGFERQPQVRSGDRIEYVNNIIHAWGAPAPKEGGGYGLRISPKNGPYPFGSMNLVGNAFLVGAFGLPPADPVTPTDPEGQIPDRIDEGCVYGDLAKGTPANDGSKGRAWNGNAGLVSRIWSEDNLLPLGRQYTTYNCTTTPGAAAGRFMRPAYAEIPASEVLASSQLAQILDSVGMPWPDAREIAAIEAVRAALKTRLGQLPPTPPASPEPTATPLPTPTGQPPTPRPPPTPPPAGPKYRVVKGQSYCSGTVHENKWDHYRSAVNPGVPHPLVIAPSAPGWGGSDRSRILNGPALHALRAFVRVGFDVASIEVRVAPPGSSNRWPVMVEDMDCAVKHMRAHAESLGLDPDRLYAWGGSGGGHVSLMAALAAGAYPSDAYPGVSSHLRAAASWYAPTKLDEPFIFDCGVAHAISQVFGFACSDPAALATLRAASPVNNVDPADPPIGIWHGMEDGTGSGHGGIPYRQAELLRDALRAARIPHQLTLVRKADHGFVGISEDAKARIAKATAAFLLAH